MTSTPIRIPSRCISRNTPLSGSGGFGALWSLTYFCGERHPRMSGRAYARWVVGAYLVNSLS